MALKKKILHFVYYWIPVIVWASCIFYMSSQTRIGIIHVYFYDFIIFKTLHMIEFGLLFFLLFRAIYATGRHKTNTNPLLIAAIITILFSVSDEFHQLFTLTREGKVRDICIDGIGIFFMYICIKRFFTYVKRIL